MACQIHDVLRYGIDFIEGGPVERVGEPIPVEYPADEPQRNECQHFLDSIAENTAPLTEGTNGLHSFLRNHTGEKTWPLD